MTATTTQIDIVERVRTLIGSYGSLPLNLFTEVGRRGETELVINASMPWGNEVLYHALIDKGEADSTLLTIIADIHERIYRLQQWITRNS